MSFITDDFLLSTKEARRLYHEYAADLPIFDYHCHLRPEQIAGDHVFSGIAEAWLAGDHYKWRAMRAAGVTEDRITGGAADEEKFRAWAQTVPSTIGNPLYHWTHLELARYFDIDDVLLNGESADAVRARADEQLTSPDMSVLKILKMMKVRFVCTTDDPVDDLSHHKAIADAKHGDLTVVPAFRPDKAIHIEQADAFREWVAKMESVTGRELSGFSDLLDALDARIDYFHELGARISDHAFVAPRFAVVSANALDKVYKTVRAGGEAAPEDVAGFQTAVMLHLGRRYAERDWTMQLHIGALRSNSTRGLKSLGPDTGFDSMADEPFAADLNKLLDAMDVDDKLPRTIVYTLNPTYNDVVATAMGNFQGGGVLGKMQFGSGWWFNDQKDGMRAQMTSLANLGLLPRFVGMLTDSRSFLSFPRHEYFRRTLCGLVGGWLAAGELPEDYDLLGSTVRDICWNNAVRYFGYNLETIDG